MINFSRYIYIYLFFSPPNRNYYHPVSIEYTSLFSIRARCPGIKTQLPLIRVRTLHPFVETRRPREAELGSYYHPGTDVIRTCTDTSPHKMVSTVKRLLHPIKDGIGYLNRMDGWKRTKIHINKYILIFFLFFLRHFP